MSTRRTPPRGAASTSASSSSSSATSFPWFNAALIAAALSLGVGTLLSRGRISWPPHQLLANLFTVAGCLGLVGPVLLGRGRSDSLGLGELLWLSGGMVIWIHDLAALARGEAATWAWSTPLGPQPMGFVILAVLLAGWRGRLSGSSWSWTNVTGWILGLFWVGMGLSTLAPARSLGLALR